MEIVFNQQEEAAVQSLADKHRITYGQAVQMIMDAMTKGLIELATDDNEFEKFIKDDEFVVK